MAEYGTACIENAGIEPLREFREVFAPLEDQRFESYGEHLLYGIPSMTRHNELCR
jgi:hypothetical protein